MLQFLLNGGNGEGAAIGAFNAEAGIRLYRCALGDLGYLLRVELSHREAQPTGVASLLARIQGS